MHRLLGLWLGKSRSGVEAAPGHCADVLHQQTFQFLGPQIERVRCHELYTQQLSLDSVGQITSLNFGRGKPKP